MGQCKDCKWWVRKDEVSGTCNHAEIGHSSYWIWTTWPGDGSTHTRPDFGCNQFEAKA